MPSRITLTALGLSLVLALTYANARAVETVGGIDARLNSSLLAKVPDLIRLDATGQKRAALYVFSDPECGPCMLLFRDLDKIRARGYEIEFAFYPTISNRIDDMSAVHCTASPQSSLRDLYRRRAIKPSIPGCKAQIDRQRDLALQMGAHGSPFIVHEAGVTATGYTSLGEFLQWADQTTAAACALKGKSEC